jgi:tripeptidyl-peptidase I
MLPLGDSVNDQETAALVYFPNETLPYSSSGGFSNYFKRPSWQNDAVEGYLEKYSHLYPSYVTDFGLSKPSVGADGGLYNRAGRGFP